MRLCLLDDAIRSRTETWGIAETEGEKQMNKNKSTQASLTSPRDRAAFGPSLR